MKTRPAETELFHKDGQTDMTKLIAAFSNFAKSSEEFRVLYLLLSSRQSHNLLRFLFSKFIHFHFFIFIYFIYFP
jgi:hypothetical protein